MSLKVDTIRPFTEGGNVTIEGFQVDTLSVVNVDASLANLGIGTKFPAKVGGFIPDSDLSANIARVSQIPPITSGVGGYDQSELIHINAGMGSSAEGPYVYQNIGNVILDNKFSIYFPFFRTDKDDDELGSFGFHIYRLAPGTTSFGSSISFGVLQDGRLFVRQYHSSATIPGGNYRTILSTQGMREITGNGGSLLIVFPKTSAPVIYFNGQKVDVVESTAGTAPAWSDSINSNIGLFAWPLSAFDRFSGTIAPFSIFAGSVTDSEAAMSPIALPGWTKRASYLESLTSGSLVNGTKYIITANSGGADFASQGAPDNNVGTEFVATASTSPTWGSGSLTKYGSICDLVSCPKNGRCLWDRTTNGMDGIISAGVSTSSKRAMGSIGGRAAWSAATTATDFPAALSVFENANVYIHDIILTASASVSVNVGTESSATYYASAESLTANQPLSIPLSARFPSGLRIRITPTASYTGWIKMLAIYSPIN